MEPLATILTNTYTRTALNSRLSLLKEFLQYQYFSAHDSPNLFFLLNEFFNQRGLSRDEFNALLAWDYPFYGQFNRQNFYAGIEALEKEAKTLPEVVLFLPFSPTLYEIPKLGGWFRRSLSPQTILDIKYDGSLIGGCSVVWKGVYHDFSLKYYLTKCKPAIKEVVEGYLKVGSGAQIV